MTKTRRISFIIFGLLFALAGFLFVGCGKPDYSNTSLVCVYEENQITSIELFAGEEKYIDFKIINPASGMSGELEKENFSIPNVATIEKYSQQNYTIQYKIKGEKGGRTTLTMTTKDGDIKTEPALEIIVKQYPSSLTATTENLFLTKEQTFTPSENYFDFGENTTEKSLKYYFFGEKENEKALGLDNLKFSAGETGYSNEFTSVSIVEKGSNEYLVFANANGESYSISKVPTVDALTGNKHYKFVKITNDNSFSNCKAISIGEKFYFVAVYQGQDNDGNDKTFACERSFKIFEDISVQKTTHYAYQRVKVVGEAELPDENISALTYSQLTFDENWKTNENLTLVPDFTTKGSENPYLNYKVAYFKVTTKTNNLLKVKPFAENGNLLSGKVAKKVKDDINGTTDYYIEISNSSGKNVETFYNIQFYYEGYENSTSSAVNFTLRLPVTVTIPPQRLLVNNQDAFVLGTYTFYNHYKGRGWQEFKFAVNPSDALVDSLTINLSQSANLQFKYKNVEYSSSSNLGGIVIGDNLNKYLSITDLNEAVYIKGVEEATEAQNQKLNIGVHFTLFGESEEKNFEINYQIAKGAKFIEDYNNATYYVDINQNGEIDASSLFKADAKFSNIYFECISGDNVVRFNTDTTVCEKDGEFYNLKFTIADKNVIGQGTYQLWLDNGESITFKIATLEALASVATSTTNILNNVVDFKINEENNVTYYVVNDLSSITDNVDIQLIANGNKTSKAISDFIVKVEEGNTILSASNINKAKNSFDILLNGENGGADVEVEVIGCSVENFAKIPNHSITYNIHFVSFAYIEKLNMTKKLEAGDSSTQGQEATNCGVYYNTQNETLRKIIFNSSVNNSDAFLFYAKNEEGELEWLEEKFDSGFITWEYKGSIYFPDQTSFETEYGYFNMKTLTFTAKYVNANLNAVTETLLARVSQKGKTYSYSINIHLEKYVEVDELTLASPLTEIRISSLDSKPVEVIAFANNSRLANNPTLTGYFVNNNISIGDEHLAMFEMTNVPNDNKFVFSISANKDFIEKAKGETKELRAKLYIVAKDWYSNDVLDNKYLSKAISIDVVYENGTENNRYTLTSEEQFENLDLQAHYRLATTIDVSSISLPLGEFAGSIVGINDYAEITGIKITDKNLTKNGDAYLPCGLFSSIKANAYIDNVIFSGSIEIGTENNATDYKNITVGIVAGVNNGALRNIAVKLSSSFVHAYSGNIGGVVGENNGTISQDYSFTSLSNIGVNVYESYKTLSTIENFIVTGYSQTDVTTVSGVINFGGVAGINKQTIQKIEAKEGETFIGYTNYFAYVNLNAVKFKTSGTTTITYSTTQFMVGSVAGDNQGGIFGAVATKDDAGNINYTSYKTYTSKINSYLDEKEISFDGGKGLVVGGKITANGFNGKDKEYNFGYKSGRYEGDCVGGIAGITNNIGNSFTGLTSRVFLRSDGNVAGIANDPKKATYGVNAFSLQAVENGELAENASMIVINRTSMLLTKEGISSEAIFSEQTRTYENIAFGSATNTSGLFTGDLISKAFVTYSSRSKALDAETDSGTRGTIGSEEYFGDYIIVGKENNIIYKYFTYDDSKIRVTYGIGDENKNNNMKYGDEKNQDNAYYAYYFELSSVSEEIDRASLQQLLNNSFNKLSSKNEFYPIKVVGELTLTSLTPNVLEIDVDGKMTFKRTGIAEISATSILNQSNELKIYIYVVNYFNSLSDNSIVYPTQSKQSTRIEKTKASIIANNRVNMYVLPDYTISRTENETKLDLDENGRGSLNNVFISLKQNDDITAEVSIKNGESETNHIKREVIGNQIILSRGENIEEKVDYNIVIAPIIRFVADGNTYKTTVNKTLQEVTASYIKGATRIYNKLHDEMTIQSSSVINDILTISTTADENTEGVNVKILDENRNPIDDLFIVKVVYKDKTTENNVNYLNYSLSIEINTDSQKFKNRANENIYKTYTFVFCPKTNSEISLSIPVTLEKTQIRGLSITNYKDASATSSSELINPGEQGHLAISLSPIDGEFDYIVVENDLTNFTDGHSSAIFGISARKSKIQGENSPFDDNNIIGANTANGIKFTRQEIEDFYSNTNYEPFNGTLYVNYLFATQNVDNNSVSTILVKAYKNNSSIPIAEANKPLTVKLPYFAKLGISDKEEDGGYFAVARGVEYKLNINTYGYDKELVEISSSNTKLATIEKRNGDYYVKITNNKISYANGNIFEIQLNTTDKDMIPFVDTISVRVQEFVVTYDGEKDFDKDVVSGMGDGIINVQIGSGLKFEIDLYDYIEFDETNADIAREVKEFMESMVKKGKWLARTNLNNSGNSISIGSTYETGYNVELKNNEIENYYFKYSNYKLTPVKTHEPIEKGYQITYSGEFEYSNGVYKVKTDPPVSGYKPEENVEHDNRNLVQTAFMFNVYTSSSDQSPIPIFEYRDLLKMHDGGYYILLNNIVIPNEETVIEKTGEVVPAFSPITAKFASLDGNGLSLIFEKGKYNVGNATKIAPFASLSSGSVIKNLTISYQSTDTTAKLDANGIGTKFSFSPALTYFETSASAFTFGGIVAENSGIITNCKVETLNNSYLSVYAPNSISGETEECYLGLVAGNNSGYITNSIVSANVQAPFSIGGITGNNNGKISGCAFKEGVISNILSKTGAVAGIAVTNAENAQILTSFVRGIQSKTSVISSKVENYGVDTQSIISSPYSASGFVYQNKGTISDCYTDINLKGIVATEGAGYKISGFVGQNGGAIRNSYSISLLPSNRDSSSGFAETNKIDDKVGSFANCFYLSDSANRINVDLKNIKFDGVENITLDDFNPNNGKFAEYAHKLTMNNESVWFYPNGQEGGDFVEYSISGKGSVVNDEAINGKIVFIGKVETKNITFACGRLELTNPNTQMLSRRIFDSATVDEESGDITYNYIDEEDCPTRGSLHNPRLIYSAETMEDEILSATSKTGLNTSNYRLISDVDYSQYVGTSQLYTVTFAGILEGNGMTVSNISLFSPKLLSNAGLFAGVGYSQNKRGSIKNFNLQLERMEFSQTTNVGGIAGVLKYGELHGISVTSSNGDGGTVVGANFVGGIVGKAILAYEITDVYSEMSVSSSYISEYSALYQQTSNDEKYYSYAGSIAGFLGTGTLYNARCANVNSVVAGKAGFAYGGLGKDARANYTFVNIKAGATIKSNLYAGFVAGEVAGSMTYAFVDDNNTDGHIFDIIARVPYAVGGITGRLAGGLISNAVNYQTLNVNNFNYNELFIEIAGGLVGIVDAENASLSRIYDSLSTADVFARELGGGGVGSVMTSLHIDALAIKAGVINISGQTSAPIAGGIIGSNEATTTITNSYCLADIELRVNTPGVEALAYAGGLVALNTSTLRLEYCYTTSRIDAEVYDARALGSIQDFENLTSENVNIKHSVVKGNISSINNVYYLGGSGYDCNKDNKNDYKNSQNYILFRSKAKDAKITMTINNFGKASRDSKETIANTESSMSASKDVMKNLFINRYAYEGTLYFKVPDIEVKRSEKITSETGFINQVGDKSYLFKENDNTTLLPRDDLTLTLDSTQEVKLGDFKQIKIYRDNDRKICSSAGENLIEIWNFNTWNEFSSLTFEKNLSWLNKTTLGKAS